MMALRPNPNARYANPLTALRHIAANEGFTTLFRGEYLELELYLSNDGMIERVQVILSRSKLYPSVCFSNLF
jgi:hypothetical protein